MLRVIKGHTRSFDHSSHGSSSTEGASRNPRARQGIQGGSWVPYEGLYTGDFEKLPYPTDSIWAPEMFGFRIWGRMPWGWVSPGFVRPHAASKKQAAVVDEVRDSGMKVILSSLSFVR